MPSLSASTYVRTVGLFGRMAEPFELRLSGRCLQTHPVLLNALLSAAVLYLATCGYSTPMSHHISHQTSQRMHVLHAANWTSPAAKYQKPTHATSLQLKRCRCRCLSPSTEPCFCGSNFPVPVTVTQSALQLQPLTLLTRTFLQALGPWIVSRYVWSVLQLYVVPLVGR
jgi:hypothetical protein